MEKTQAWELVNNPDYCSRLTMGELRELMVRAGYSADAVNRAAKQRGWDRLSAGVTM